MVWKYGPLKLRMVHVTSEKLVVGIPNLFDIAVECGISGISTLQ